MSNEIWLNNPTILLQQEQLGQIWPLGNMNIEEKINAITRLIILLTILGYLITFNFTIVLIGLVSIISLLLLYFLSQKSKKEGFLNNITNVQPVLTSELAYNLNRNNFKEPTEENPLMNVLIPEVHYNPKRKPAAPTFNRVVEDKINDSVKSFIGKSFNDKNINDKLFADLGDDITFNRSMISFSATANTQIPNDQKAFTDFAYGDMISGKEGHPLALERTQSGSYNYTNY